MYFGKRLIRNDVVGVYRNEADDTNGSILRWLHPFRDATVG